MCNEAVEPEAIRASGFESLAQQAQAQNLLLAVKDSTSISYTHAVAAELGITEQARCKAQWFSGTFAIIDGCGERAHCWPNSATTSVPRS